MMDITDNSILELYHSLDNDHKPLIELVIAAIVPIHNKIVALEKELADAQTLISDLEDALMAVEHD